MTADFPVGGEYGAILIDPPWAFRTFSRRRGTTPHRGSTDHYKTMPLYQICGLPVPDAAARNCALFVWTVDSHLRQTMTVLDAWEFTYKTIVFVWEKLGRNGEPRMGMGYWSRKQAEVCLLATRGSPRRLDKGVPQLISAPRREHSRKPDEQYARIERLVDGPYLELFARRRREGWDAWGDQLPRHRSRAG